MGEDAARLSALGRQRAVHIPVLRVGRVVAVLPHLGRVVLQVVAGDREAGKGDEAKARDEQSPQKGQQEGRLNLNFFPFSYLQIFHLIK